jgi:uncharacterized membrane-anchored protein
MAYSAGNFLLLRYTPQILKRRFDEWRFTLLAAIDILGGLLVFAPIGIMFAFFNAAPGIRILDIILLAVVAGISLRLAYRSFFPWRHPNPLRSTGAIRLSGILAGCYCVLLVAAALYALIMTVALPS